MDLIVEWPMYLTFYDFALAGIALVGLLLVIVFACWAAADLRVKRQAERLLRAWVYVRGAEAAFEDDAIASMGGPFSEDEALRAVAWEVHRHA